MRSSRQAPTTPPPSPPCPGLGGPGATASPGGQGVALSAGGGVNSSGAGSAHASSLTAQKLGEMTPALVAAVQARPGRSSAEDRCSTGGADPRPGDLPEVTGLHEERPPRLLPRSQGPAHGLTSGRGERRAGAAPHAPEAPAPAPRCTRSGRWSASCVWISPSLKRADSSPYLQTAVTGLSQLTVKLLSTTP